MHDKGVSTHVLKEVSILAATLVPARGHDNGLNGQCQCRF